MTLHDKPQKILVTGSAGFIGFHLSELLLQQGHHVLGVDGLTHYYDVTLKEKRHAILQEYKNFIPYIGMLEDYDNLHEAANNYQPNIIIHLAAQAGVRHSLEYPRDYINANIIGTFNIMELARIFKVQHLLLASTSSIYGANKDFPFQEKQKTETPLTIYAATKKSTELLTHSYAHLWNIPTTCFRFFTVYGPWGRPDMALFKFVKNMLESTPIDIYNHGKMSRDFTYVKDLVYAISLLKDAIPTLSAAINHDVEDHDSISPVAPWRSVNIGGGSEVNLLDFVEAIEETLSIKAIRNYMPMQTGDVSNTKADHTLLSDLIGYIPMTHYRDGVKAFIEWYKDYYKI